MLSYMGKGQVQIKKKKMQRYFSLLKSKTQPPPKTDISPYYIFSFDETNLYEKQIFLRPYILKDKT